ncbi:MAG: hypothetical protein WA208_19520 [Thermoanaerobaculia bacterium]
MPDHSFLELRRLPPAADPFAQRVTQLREGNRRGEHVLYWARSARRATNNLALEFAKTLGPRVVMAEWLDEPHLTERTEAFIRAGSDVTAARADVEYLFEPPHEVVERARYVVTDDFPTLSTPAFVTHLVDQNGVVPMRAMKKEHYAAKFFRDKFWSCAAPLPLLTPPTEPLRIDGYAESHSRSLRFTTGLSPRLHFGHVGVHEVLAAVRDAPDDDYNAFVEQLVIRRELSFNLCFYNPRYASLDALPEWARTTLDRHRSDRRKPVYTFEELAAAATHDEVWNLAQRQLLVTGTMHGYLRMLWGKKIIEWSETPEMAHAAMIRFHDVYALDGRDPNTHAGVLWCFGKHDRPWAPERPIFGTIRWMSSAQTAKKVRLKEIEEIVGRAEG